MAGRFAFQHCHQRLGAEHGLTGTCKAQHGGETPPIGGFVRLGAIDDFRGDEPGRAHDQTGARHMRFAFAHRDAEIHQHRAGIRNHDVRRLDVAVNDSRRVHCIHRVDEALGEMHEVHRLVAAVALHVVEQIGARDEFGHDER